MVRSHMCCCMPTAASLLARDGNARIVLCPCFTTPPPARCALVQFGAQEPGSNSEIKSFAERKGFKGPMVRQSGARRSEGGRARHQPGLASNVGSHPGCTPPPWRR